MVSLRSLLLAVLALQPLALANPLVERKITCANPKVKSLIKTAKSVAGKQINTFCSSYLHYKSKTKTIVETFTYTSVVDEFTTEGTVTYITFATTTVSGTVTVTRTIGLYEGLGKRDVAAGPTAAVDATATSAQITQAAEYDDAEDSTGDIQERALPKKLKPDSRGCVLGFSASIVSEACSCLVKKPTLATTTSYFRIDETATATYTEPSATAWTTSVYTAHDDLVLSKVSTVTIAKPTNCGTEAQPSFFVQIRDVDRSSTDQWDNNYLSLINSANYRGWEGDAVLMAEAPKGRAVLVTIEPGTGYLREVRKGRYLNVDYFNSFQLPFWNSKAWIDARAFQYVVCKIVPAGNEKELQCNVPQSAWDIHIWQTCPLYYEWFGTSVVFGDEFSKTTPDCFEKKLYLVNACA
ncbi:hypothetical protein G7Z17_g11904 [Cylindrodendrum hubeiense]|uniref:Uncharacterized protein n=1 Tax=Cylindrodendrum hubeiense TaxID=595255 RepID=A0A9P5GV35_9HYPO|nr:hypothetical protein G7Z17_g11904 [Cylindrodendrum hubeiense]